MEFDDQMLRFFGTDDLGAVSPAAMASGVERMRVEFGLETDKGRKFAMWSLHHSTAGSTANFLHASESCQTRAVLRRFGSGRIRLRTETPRSRATLREIWPRFSEAAFPVLRWF